MPYLEDRVADLEHEVEDLRHRLDAEPEGWLRGAKAIADYLGYPTPARVWDLSGCTPPRIPVEHDGQQLMAKASELDDWVRNGGGRTP
jgi:hypothetical protein